MAKGKGVSNLIHILLLLLFVCGIVYSMKMISADDITDREAAMFGLFLTVLSTMASWLVTQYYAEYQYKNALQEVQEQHRTNLKMYALKAAEKVNNLSNELNRLSLYLQEELDYTAYSGTEEELHAKEERLESAIHLLQTLKSVNDTALSDWEGVIGDELDQQREEKEEKEEEIKTLLDRYQTLLEDQKQDYLGKQHDAELLHIELASMKKDMRRALLQLGKTALPKSTSKKAAKQAVQLQCPSCSSNLEYRQRPIESSVKSLSCKSCEAKLLSTFSEKTGFGVQIRENLPIQFACPQCSTTHSSLLDSLPGISITVPCSNCKSVLRVLRRREGIEVKVQESDMPGKPKITEEVIENIRKELPPQPWPKSVHKIVAAKLKLQPKIVTGAINHLIDRKIFLPQKDGVLYAPITEVHKNAQPDN